MITTTRREQGPPTSCHRCGEGSIYGFAVVDTAHGIHRVLCTDCARVAVEVAERPCEGCGVMVPEDEFCGNTRSDGTSEYLCCDCYVPDPHGKFKTPDCAEMVRAAAPDLLDALKACLDALQPDSGEVENLNHDDPGILRSLIRTAIAKAGGAA